MLKACFKCGESKERSEFYKHPRMADGLLGKCKECTKADVSARRVLKHAEICAYDRERSRGKQRRSPRNKYRDRARSKVARAVKSGKLVPRPCTHCGDIRVQAHHRDYDKPLDVVWCCFKCHREIEHGHKMEVGNDDFSWSHFVAKVA